MNGTSSSSSAVRPDAEESQQFWRDIWGKEVLHNENSEWLKELKRERAEARQEGIVITAEIVTARSKKISNWKAPGPDSVQGYWIKKLTALHERMADHMNDLKLMTGIIADSMYEFFVENDALPVEQTGCKRKSTGTKDQLLIDKMVLADCKRKHKNLAMRVGGL